jgi:UDP-glucose 4-epimerase
MNSVWRGRQVAVIGASGFVGSHLVEKLVTEGANVLAVARRIGCLNALSHLDNRYLFRSCDITDPQTIESGLCSFRPEIVFHLAAHPDGAESLTHMHACVRANMIGGLNALAAAIAAGGQVFILADSCKVYGNSGVPYLVSQSVDPICSYAITKTALWQLCQLTSTLSDIHVVGLRMTFVYGPRQGWNLIRYVQKCVREGAPIRLQGGTQTRDPLYIDDAVDALLAAAISPAAFNYSIPIGGGTEISVVDLCKAALVAMGQQASIVEDAETPRLTEIWRSISDNSDARRLLNWTPKISLREGLTRTLGDQAGEE